MDKSSDNEVGIRSYTEEELINRLPEENCKRRRVEDVQRVEQRQQQRHKAGGGSERAAGLKSEERRLKKIRGGYI